MRIRSVAIVAAATGMIAFAAPSPCLAQESRIPAEKEQVIRKVLELTRTTELMLLTIETGLQAQRLSNPNIPAVFWDRFLERVQKDRHVLLDSIVPIYHKHFTLAELRGLVQFYESPIGKRFIDATPNIARESMLAGQRWGMIIGQEIGEQMQREGLVPRPPE